MTPSTQLFELIKSLSSSEKRYFRLQSSLQAGDKIYLEIFNEIDQQKIYDEAVLLKKISKKKNFNNFSAYKSYLTGQIIKSLRNYNSDTSNNFEFLSTLMDLEIIYNKGLYHLYEKRLGRIKQRALATENFFYLAKFISLEMILSRNMVQGYKSLRIYRQELRDAQKKDNNITEYQHIHSQLNSFIRSTPYTRNMRFSFDKYIDVSLVKDKKKAITYTSLAYFYLCNTLLFYWEKKYEKAFSCAQSLIILSEEKPYLKSKFIISILNAYINSAINYKKFKDAEAAVAQLMEVKGHDYLSKKSITGLGILFYLSIYSQTGEVKKGLDILQKYQQELSRLFVEKKWINNSVLFFHIASIYFMAQKYKEALYYINKILSSGSKEVIPEVFLNLKILSIIIFYESEENTILESAITSTYRYLRKKEMLEKNEKIILRFISRIYAKLTPGNLISEFKILRRDLAKDNILSGRSGNIHFDFISWLDSKIEQRPFSEILKEKARNNK